LSKNKLKSKSKKDFLELCKGWIIKSLSSKEFQNPRLLYAEHPYVTVDYFTDDLKIEVDIVLYFNLALEYIKNTGPITAVDRSPWHGRFIKDNLSTKQKNEVRLLKQFFKASHCYGDKSVVGKMGFFGYSAELLIFYYNSLLNLFNDFESLKNKPLDYYHRSIEELKKIPHFQNDFLVIVDPIDKNRNVASAISDRAYKYCNYRIQALLEKPSKELFKIKPIPEEDLSIEKNPILSNIYIIELKDKDPKTHYTINRDKLYSLGQGIKLHGEREFSHIERFGRIEFEIYFDDKLNEYNIAIYSEKKNISKTYLRKGPPLTSKSHVEKFKQKNPNFIEKNNFLWTETKREHSQFLSFLKEFVKGKIPENLDIINLSKALKAKSKTAKKAIYVLNNYILPFC
jgi:tRNA nucleotidyltransferase (CCA-adding enzyme)